MGNRDCWWAISLSNLRCSSVSRDSTGEEGADSGIFDRAVPVSVIRAGAEFLREVMERAAIRAAIGNCQKQ